MIYWKQEGSRLYQGLSVYHPKDQYSAGFALRVGEWALSVRYSKITKKWYTGTMNLMGPKFYRRMIKKSKHK